MAHQVETMMSANGQVPWHGLGEIVAGAPTAQEAIKLAGLNWKAEEKQIFTFDHEQKDYKRVESHKAIIRSTDGKELGVVGKDYTPVQNEQAFAWFNPFVESKLATFETAGSLREGKKVWVLAKLNKKPIEVAKGDTVDKFLLLSNGHDGATAVRVGFTPIRVVCNNTLSAAEGKFGGSQLMRISHTKGVHGSLDQVREIVNAADAQFEASAEQYKALAKKSNVSKSDIESYVKILFFTGKKDSKRLEMRMEKMNETITRLFETGRGNDLKGVKGTYWALYNSVTEYLSYESGRSQDNRLNSLWFGKKRTKNEQALNVAMKMAGL